MKITVLGANGQTGLEVVKQALAAGHVVTGLVRKPGNNPKVRYVVGDATDTQAVTDASKGSDAIISVLGGTNTSLIASAMNAVVASTKVTGVKRVVLMSTFLVQKSHLQGLAKLASWATTKMTNDKATGENILRGSGLDWTIVYATLLTNGPKGSEARVVPADEKIGLKHKVARADVASWMLSEVENNKFVKAAVTIAK